MKKTSVIPITALIIIVATPLVASSVEFEGEIITGAEDFNLIIEDEEFEQVQVEDDGVALDEDLIYLETEGPDELEFELETWEPTGETMLTLTPTIPSADVTIDQFAVELDSNQWPDNIAVTRGNQIFSQATHDQNNDLMILAGTGSDEVIQEDEEQFSYEFTIPEDAMVIQWSDGDDNGEFTEEFHIYRGENEFPDPETESPIASVSSSTYVYTDTEADEENIEYCYKITAENSIGEESAPTGEVADACGMY